MEENYHQEKAENKATSNWIAAALVVSLLAIAWALSAVLSHQASAVVYYLAAFCGYMIFGFQVIRQAEYWTRKLFLYFSFGVGIIMVLIAIISIFVDYPGVWKSIGGWWAFGTGLFLIIAALFDYLACDDDRRERELEAMHQYE